MVRTKAPLVGIIMGSSSDSDVMHGAAQILDEFGVQHEDQIISAHRTPDMLDKYARHAEKTNLRVIIAGAGGAAHLPGMIASHTYIPVIGVPIMAYSKIAAQMNRAYLSSFGGLDSLLSMSEMPTGSPVACVGINKSANAGIYALKILATESLPLRKKLMAHKDKQSRAVIKESKNMRSSGLSKFTAKRRNLKKVR